MTDKFSAEFRSEIMRRVKGKNTRPEIFIRRLIYCLGYRYRLYRKDLPGTPDLTFSSRKKIIFIHGCFWHGHDCKRGQRIPVKNNSYWVKKISKNKERFGNQINELDAGGWEVLVIWECEIKKSNYSMLINKIKEFLG